MNGGMAFFLKKNWCTENKKDALLETVETMDLQDVRSLICWTICDIWSVINVHISNLKNLLFSKLQR